MHRLNPLHGCSRRQVLFGLCSLPLAAFGTILLTQISARAGSIPAGDVSRFQKDMAALEAKTGGRLGVAAALADGGGQISYRGDERFPMCSTFKTLAAAAILRDKSNLLGKKIRFSKTDMQPWSPVTEKHIENGMTVAELCAAMLQHSDNTAANLVLAQLGGPEALTAFARSVGDATFRLDRWEVALNSAIPGDERDTTTPIAMCAALGGLLCGNRLPEAAKKQLTDWMLGCATGAARIPAGMPQGWRAAHKTGAGDNGTFNDTGVLLPPDSSSASLVLALYLTGSKLAGQENDRILAEATRMACAAEGLAAQ